MIVAVTGLLICLWGIWNAGRTGLSRLLSKYAIITIALNAPTLTPADQAVRLTPGDPDAHFRRAIVLWNLGRTSEAVEAYERAAALRPRDYYLWMMLGNARDQIEDEKGALAALTEAVREAPYYAQPRWQYGNVLFRAGQSDEGFAEMRRAALSDQKFLPNMIDLAWGASNKDPAATERLVQPENRLWHVALARYFAKRKSPAAALAQYRAADAVAEPERQALINELLTAKGYAEAYEVWATGEHYNRTKPSGPGQITNGSFEEQLRFDESGFAWQFVRNPAAVQFSLDTTEPNAGTHSLRLEWNGNSAPTPPVASQLVLVEPNTRYRLSFAVRTQEIVSGGLPIVVLIDKNVGDDRPLAQSRALPKGSVGWQDYSLEFTTASDTRAVLIALQREGCGAGDPCPIFGRLWLDNFSLLKL
jgi:tetratricopeptide (TPR) repeat protein